MSALTNFGKFAVENLDKLGKIGGKIVKWGAGLGALGGAAWGALEIDQGLRGQDSFKTKLDTNQAAAQGAAVSAGTWAGIKEAFSNFLGLIADIFNMPNFAAGLRKRLTADKERPNDNVLGAAKETLNNIGNTITNNPGTTLGVAATATVGTYAAVTAVNKLKGGGNGPTNTGGGNTPNGDGGMKLNKAEKLNDDTTKKKGYFSKTLDGAKSLGSKLFKRLPVIGAVATAAATTTGAAKASQATDTFQKAAGDMSPAQRIEASNAIATQEKTLGGDIIGGAAATAGGLGAAFFLASNPVGWATTAVIGTSVAVGFAAQAIGDNITVDDKGTSLSQWTGNKVTNAFSAAAEKTSELSQTVGSKLNNAFTSAKNWLSGEEAKPEAIHVKNDNAVGKNVFDGTPFTSNVPF